MTSDNVLADRRFEFAEMMRERGDLMGAISLYREALDLAPDWAAAHFSLAEALAAADMPQDASRHYTDYLRLTDEDTMGAEIRLALLGTAPVPDILPEAYVRTLFDQYADSFEEKLLTKLDYTAPSQLRRALDRVWTAGKTAAHALDIGCGTGLAGEAFRDRCAWLGGVDLSPQMIAKAARKKLYDDLADGEAIAALGRQPHALDLIIAADVLVYIGDLQALFGAASQVLSPGGLFVFSVERAEGVDFQLRDRCRYAHGAGYLKKLAADLGFEVRVLEDAACRAEAGVPVAHLIVVLEKPGVAIPTLATDDTGAVVDMTVPSLE